MSLASTRERRVNAGSKMVQMLDKEEDDFYKQTYGGFFEEENDNEYEAEGSESDEVDSDFDISETDEVIEQGEDEPKRKKKTQAYREPKKETKSIESGEITPTVKRERKPKKVYSDCHYYDPIGSESTKKSFRSSTKKKTEQAEHRHRESAKKPKKAYNRGDWKILTQEELLREAKITEKLNLKSLEKHEKLELEKAKKNKIVKEEIRGPMLRYQSLSMPLVETDENGETIETSKRYSRDFITFTDDDTFNRYFKQTPKPQPVSKPSICQISNMKARYFDPVTQMPFSTTAAFKALREAYCQQLEILGDVKNPEIAQWIEWRKQKRAEVEKI